MDVRWQYIIEQISESYVQPGDKQIGVTLATWTSLSYPRNMHVGVRSSTQGVGHRSADDPRHMSPVARSMIPMRPG